MTVKRVAALLLSLLLLLGALPSALADSPHTHAWKEISRVNPTCTKDGYAVYVCSCGSRKTEKLAALGHKFSQKVYVGYADCEHYGVFYWVCERCGAHSGNGNDKPLGHDWDEGVVTKAPTATEDGIRTYTCKRDPSHTKTEVISATGKDEKPALTITLWAEDWYTKEKKTEFKEGEMYSFKGSVTNTGNVDIELYDRDKFSSYGASMIGDAMSSRYLLKPGESVESWGGHLFLGVAGSASAKKVTPGTSTETLAGTITESYTVRGYRPGTDEVICTDTASASIYVLKFEEEKPELSIALWSVNQDSGEKQTEFIDGEKYMFRGSVENTGNVDIELYDYDKFISGVIAINGAVMPSRYLLKPGETVENWDVTSFLGVAGTAYLKDVTLGTSTETLAGTITYTPTVRGYRPGTNEVICTASASASIGVFKPEEAKPGLTIKWDYDQIFHHDSTSVTTEITTEPGVLGWNDSASPMFTVTNTGNVPLRVIQYYVYGNGWNGEIVYSTLSPSTSVQHGNLLAFLHVYLTPGTETDELFGTVTVSLYCAGYDPETYEDKENPGKELCRTETITRTWMIGKDKGSGSGDHCALTLDTLGDTEANYTLHTCPEHLGTAEEAEKLSAAGDWAGAAELWKAEIDKLYGEMAEALGERADNALKEDREAFFEYAQAVQALFGYEKAAELMRLRCAEMCCVKSTAPIRLPSSLLGGYETLDASESFEVSGRKVGALNGCNSEVVERYAGPAAEAMAKTRALLDTDANGAFAQAAEYWKTAVDDTVSAVYRTAGREIRTLIAAWSMSLNYLCESDIKLYSLIYPADPDAAQEHMMDLYRNAALLIGGMG